LYPEKTSLAVPKISVVVTPSGPVPTKTLQKISSFSGLIQGVSKVNVHIQDFT
jgi:hypothetical protein